MGAEHGKLYYPPGVIDTLPYAAATSCEHSSRNVRRLPECIEVAFSSNSKGQRAKGYTDYQGIDGLSTVSRADTVDESRWFGHPEQIALRKAEEFRTNRQKDDNTVFTTNDIARIIDGSIRYKPTAQTLDELQKPLTELLCRPEPTRNLQVINAQALAGPKGQVVWSERYSIEFDQFSPLEVHAYLFGLAPSPEFTSDQNAQLSALFAQISETFEGILSPRECEALLKPKNIKLLRKVNDGILLEDPLFQFKIHSIDGVKKTDPGFRERLRRLIEASLGLPRHLYEMLQQYQQSGPTTGVQNIYPLVPEGGHGLLRVQDSQSSVPTRHGQAVTLNGNILGHFELQAHAGRIEIPQVHTTPFAETLLIPLMVNQAERFAERHLASSIRVTTTPRLQDLIAQYGFVACDTETPARSRKQRDQQTMERHYSAGTR